MNRTFFLVFGGLALVAGAIAWWILSAPEEDALPFRIEANDVDKAEIEVLSERLDAAEDGGALSQELLLDTRHAHLRSLPAFRRLFRRVPPVRTLTVVRDEEPGDRLLILGRITDETEAPVPGALVYMHQVDAGGGYHPSLPEGEAAARIFGFVRTDERGEFEIRTVRPGNFAYAPKTPARITLRAVAEGYDAVELDLRPSLYFADDPHLDSSLALDIENERGVIATPRPDAKEGHVVSWSYVLRRRPPSDDQD